MEIPRAIILYRSNPLFIPRVKVGSVEADYYQKGNTQTLEVVEILVPRLDLEMKQIMLILITNADTTILSNGDGAYSELPLIRPPLGKCPDYWRYGRAGGLISGVNLYYKAYFGTFQSDPHFSGPD